MICCFSAITFVPYESGVPLRAANVTTHTISVADRSFILAGATPQVKTYGKLLRCWRRRDRSAGEVLRRSRTSPRREGAPKRPRRAPDRRGPPRNGAGGLRPTERRS